MITNSELRSIDLNILGEWYIPSSDIFSDNKETENQDDYNEDYDENREMNIRQSSRNVEIVAKRTKKGDKMDSIDSQKIDWMLRKSIDSFIYETKDLLIPSKRIQKGTVQKNITEKGQDAFDTDQSSKHYNTQNSNMPRSASQKYNYKRAPIGELHPKYVNVSPMHSGGKRTINRKTQQRQVYPAQSHINHNLQNDKFNKYASLIQPSHQVDAETYYAHNMDGPRQAQHYSFNAPRRSDHVEGYSPGNQGLIYPNIQHASLDENNFPSTMNRFQVPYVNLPSGTKQYSPEFQYIPDDHDFHLSSQRHVIGRSPMTHGGKGTISSDKIYMKNPQKLQYTESHSIDHEYSPKSGPQFVHSANVNSKRRSNQTIQEEKESKSSKEEIKQDESGNKHNRNYTEMVNHEEGMFIDDTVYTSNHANSKYLNPNIEAKSVQKATGSGSKTQNHDSFTRQIENISKNDSPEGQRNQMSFLCFNLYEILNRNKIPVNNNPEDSSQDMIIKIFETLAHDLRLKRDRVEILENEDLQKTKTIDILTDTNDQLYKANEKMQRKIDEQEKEYKDHLKNQDQTYEQLRTNEKKNRILEAKLHQIEEENNDFKAQIKDLNLRLKQKEESIFRNKMIKDKANASFDIETSNENLIADTQYFNTRKKKSKNQNNHITLGNHNILHTEESDDFSRAGISAEKQNKIKLMKGHIFDSGSKSHEDTDIEYSWFYKVLNELFAPYKKCDQNELLNIIREQYGKLLQSEELIQLKTQIEIILGLPKNCSKSIIINKIKDLRTNNLMASSHSNEIGVKVEDYDSVNKNFEAYEEMKNMFSAIKSSLKLPNNATFTETLRAAKKTLTKKSKEVKEWKEKIEKIEKKVKPKTKVNFSRVSLNKTKIDLAPPSIKKSSPSREVSPAVMPGGPSSARNDRSSKFIFGKVSNTVGPNGVGRLQPNQGVNVKRKKKTPTSNSTSWKKRSPQSRKMRAFK
jgi:hypothetical protein